MINLKIVSGIAGFLISALIGTLSATERMPFLDATQIDEQLRIDGTVPPARVEQPFSAFVLTIFSIASSFGSAALVAWGIRDSIAAANTKDIQRLQAAIAHKQQLAQTLPPVHNDSKWESEIMETPAMSVPLMLDSSRQKPSHHFDDFEQLAEPTHLPSPEMPAPVVYATPVQSDKPERYIDLRTQLKHNLLSWVLAGPPGVGKTTQMLAWIADILSTRPDTQIFINGWKADSYLGLAEIPGVYTRNERHDYSPFFDQVEKVGQQLGQRLSLPEVERKNLNLTVLVLDDYFATANGAAKLTGDDAKRWQNAQKTLGQIITLGRDSKVLLAAATHSANTKALGIEDANIRGCLGLCVAGKIYKNAQGRREGGYDLISNVLRNPYIIDSSYREELDAKFAALRPISERTEYPIILVTMGIPEIGLKNEDLSWVKSYQIQVEPIAPAKKKGEILQFPGITEDFWVTQTLN